MPTECTINIHATQKLNLYWQYASKDDREYPTIYPGEAAFHNAYQLHEQYWFHLAIA
jgi:hypothetical protein